VRRRRSEISQGDGYTVRAVGVRAPGLRDLYHWLLRIPWWAMLLVIVCGYLALNALFALAYEGTGGVANAAPGSFSDAFFFSVQTMGTMGYGVMAPATDTANVLVVCESVVGILATALSTGLVFVRFSQTRARVVFSRCVAIAPMDGVPTLVIRVGNDRRTAIVDATFRVTLSVTTKLSEGSTFFRAHDLELVRSRAGALARSWMVMHRLEAPSLLARATPADLVAMDAELSMSVLGLDEVSLQPVYARHTWSVRRIVFGARFADVLTELDDGNLLLDLGQFHVLEPTPATEGFPYSFSGDEPR